MLSTPEILIADIELVFRDIIQWKELSDITKYWINFRVWEDFSKELYNHYLWYNFLNVNEFSDNHAAIDIGDEENRLCIQVTKNISSEKIKHTIKMFEKYKLYEKYDELQILLITLDKDIPKYKSDFKTNWKYKFSKDCIIGINHIIKKISNLDVAKLESFLDFCVKHFPNKKISSWSEYSTYNLIHDISVSEEWLSDDLNKIKDIISINKEYDKWMELLDKYLSNNKKDLDIAYNLKWVAYFNWRKDFLTALSFFEQSINVNKLFYKAIVNKIKSIYQIFIDSDKNDEDFEYLYSYIKTNLENINDKELLTETLEIYWSILLIKSKTKLYDEYINIITKLENLTEFMYDALYLMYQELWNKELGKEVLENWLIKYPNSYKLKLDKINQDLEELDKNAIRYNMDILPKLDEKQYKNLYEITERYYSLLEDIEKSKDPEKTKNQRKYQIYLLSFQLWINNEEKYKKLYNSIDLNQIEKYHIWKFDLLRINQNLQERHFEVAYKILDESIVKTEIPFVEFVKLAWIFIYHWWHKYWNDILNNLRYFKDFDVNYIEYWEYLIQSEVLLWNDENIKNYLLETKNVFKDTQYYSRILQIEISTKNRDLNTQEKINEFSKSLFEYHKENWDSDLVRAIKIDEKKDIIKQLKKQLPKWSFSVSSFNIEEQYLNTIIPHYCLKKWGTYIDLLTKREPYLPIRIGFLDTEKEKNLVESKFNNWKFILSFESLFNLNELKILEYYQLKNLLKNDNDEFELLITRELINNIRDELQNKEDPRLRKIYTFVLDNKIKVIEQKWKIIDFLTWWKIKENEKTYIIMPKWLINSISFAKKHWAVFITDDTSNLETSKAYWIEVIDSQAINWKRLKNPIFSVENKSESIMNLSKYNYTFISFSAIDLLYIYDKGNNPNEKVVIYQKYHIDYSFFYLCNQIIVNWWCNLKSFFNVFMNFANKVENTEKEKFRIYLVFFIYLFNEFFKKYIWNLHKLKNNAEIFKWLYDDLNKYIDFTSYTIIGMMRKLDMEQLNELLEDYKFLSEKDSEFAKWFWTYIPQSIENLIKQKKLWE